MPTADPHEFNIATRAIRWFPVLQRAATEAYAGNGIQSPGDLAVTATATDLEIEVAAGTAVYNGDTASLGTAVTQTLSGGGTNPRYDTVAFDAGTASVVVREGAAESNPIPPDLQGDELLLAVVFVAAGATDVADADIYNWRSEVAPAVRAGQYPFANADLANPSVTVADNSVNLGESTAVAYPDLSDTASFPIPNGDLANSVVTVAGNPVNLGGSTSVGHADLSNIGTDDHHTDPTAGTGLTDEGTNRFGIASGGVTDTEIASGGVTNSELASGSVTDTEIASATTIARGKLDDERITTGAVTTNTTTSGEEVLLVDTSGGRVTITLASADLSTGTFVTIVDVGGSAEQNPITVDTEGSENIDGGASIAVDTDYGATVVVADADSGQWYTAGGGGGGGAALVVQDDGSTVEDPVETLDAQAGLQATSPAAGVVELAYEHREAFEGRESGKVSNTDQGILVIDHLADGETVAVYKAALTLATGEPAPTDLNLRLVTLDNAGGFAGRGTLISGDGATVFDDETGTPLGSYTNTSGGGQTIGVLVDNNTGNPQDVMAAAEGVTDA